MEWETMRNTTPSGDSSPPGTGLYLIFDTETTGLPKNRGNNVHDVRTWPRLVQIAWLLCNSEGEAVGKDSIIIRPDNFMIPVRAADVHGITTESAMRSGIPLREALAAFRAAAAQSTCAVAHNLEFDSAVVAAECSRVGMKNPLYGMPSICTMQASVRLCRIRRPGGYKWPTLTELHMTLFGADYAGAHCAENDAAACARCFFEMRRRGILR